MEPDCPYTLALLAPVKNLQIKNGHSLVLGDRGFQSIMSSLFSCQT